MAFPAVAAVLIGGASARKLLFGTQCFGTVLFQTLLTIALPVTRSVIEGHFRGCQDNHFKRHDPYALTRKEGDG